MKRIVILLSMLMVVSLTQAQIGSAIGKKLKEKAAQTISGALGGNQTQSQTETTTTVSDKSKTSDGSDELTPEKVMAMVPTMPNPQQLAEYLCEANRANPRTIKMLANPTTSFIAQLGVAGAGGYASMASQNGYGGFYNFDEQLLTEFGITPEQYEAMSEEEQQQIALKYAGEMQDRYYKTIERLGSDEQYKTMMERYNAVEDKISKIYSDADSVCVAMWQSKYGAKANPTEDDMCSYYRMAMPTYYQAVVQAMKVRKTEQLAVAKEIDKYVQVLAARYPNEVYAGLYSQASVCAAAYVADAARVTTLSDPR